MGKKRVHEIARELKDRGIEMENRDLVNQLQSLGFDVKSHSSSLDDDQASVAVDRIVQARRPKPAAPVAATSILVRKRKVEPSEATAPTGAPPALTTEPLRAEPEFEPEPTFESDAEFDAGATPEPYESEEASAPMPEPESIREPAPREPVRQVEEVAASAAPMPVPEQQAPAAGAHPSTMPSTPSSEAAPDAVRAPTAPGGAPVRAPVGAPGGAPGASAPSVPAASAAGAGAPSVQGGQGAQGAPSTTRPAPTAPGAPSRPVPPRQTGFKPATVIPGRVAPGFKPPVRPPPRPAGSPPPHGAGRPGGYGAPGGHGGPGGPGGARPGGPQRPTATQAVVISRPNSPVRRVTPPSDARSRFPQAPGPRAITSTMPTFVPPPTDRERESPERRRGGRTDIKPNLSKQELVDLARGRTALPLRAGKKKKPVKKGAKTQITQMSEEKKVIKLDETITVNELSQTLGVKAGELLRKLMATNMGININSSIDADTAELIAADYGWRVERQGFEIEDYISEEESLPENLVGRPPVVTIMGHVDHGKTSLLDAIRSANVAAGEAGGITQHIGAYSVQTAAGKAVTFLDTPGHEAFTAMRARGAQVTDLVVIVVAADDGVMPQTREAINHAKAAEVPILVAVNKMDKPSANPQHVKNQLMEFGLVDEQLGGDTIMVPVSAKTRQGIPELLEMILLQAEVLELKADPTRPAKGTVVEAKLEKGRGPCATVIVHEGTLRVGDAVTTGTQYGRIRAMLNDRGEKVDDVQPGFPVEILGLSGVPTAGDDFFVVENEAAAKEIAEHRIQKEREKEATKTAKVGLEFLSKMVQAGEMKELKLIVKADVQGSVEAVCEALKKLSTPKVALKIIDSGVGGIRESDVMLASASNGMIVGFNVRPEPKTAEVATQQGVEIRVYGIIYEAVDEVRSAMEGLLEPTRREKVLGRAEVRSIFSSPKVGTVAGCAVVDGKVSRSAQVRLLRDSRIVYTGKIGSLRRFKDDVREVVSGFECGLSIENYTDVKQGDVIEAFEIEEIRATL